MAVPIYEYSCTHCGRRFDRLQGLSDPRPACPNCGETKVNRMISLIAGLGGSAGSAGAMAGCGCGGACACGR